MPPFDINGAKSAGYTDDEIISHLTATRKFDVEGAKKAGYSSQEILTHLQSAPTVAPTAPAEETGGFVNALLSGFATPVKELGKTARALGAETIGSALEATPTPKGYVSAGERFMNPREGDLNIGGFAPAYLPRAAVEQAGQLAGSLVSRAGAVALGGALAGPGGAAFGAIAGPAAFGAAQVIGSTAFERAKNNNREKPNAEDLLFAVTTGAGSGLVDAFGVDRIMKAGGPILKRLASGSISEFSTEFAQSIIEQLGGTAGTEKGVDISGKQAVGEGLIGGVTGGVASAALGSNVPQRIAEEEKEAATEPLVNVVGEDVVEPSMPVGGAIGIKDEEGNVKVATIDSVKSVNGVPLVNFRYHDENTPGGVPGYALVEDLLPSVVATDVPPITPPPPEANAEATPVDVEVMDDDASASRKLAAKARKAAEPGTEFDFTAIDDARKYLDGAEKAEAEALRVTSRNRKLTLDQQKFVDDQKQYAADFRKKAQELTDKFGYTPEELTPESIAAAKKATAKFPVSIPPKQDLLNVKVNTGQGAPQVTVKPNKYELPPPIGPLSAYEQYKPKSLYQYLLDQGGIDPNSDHINDVGAGVLNKVYRTGGMSVRKAVNLAEKAGYLGDIKVRAENEPSTIEDMDAFANAMRNANETFSNDVQGGGISPREQERARRADLAATFGNNVKGEGDETIQYRAHLHTTFGMPIDETKKLNVYQAKEKIEQLGVERSKEELLKESQLALKRETEKLAAINAASEKKTQEEVDAQAQAIQEEYDLNERAGIQADSVEAGLDTTPKQERFAQSIQASTPAKMTAEEERAEAERLINEAQFKISQPTSAASSTQPRRYEDALSSVELNSLEKLLRKFDPKGRISLRLREKIEAMVDGKLEEVDGKYLRNLIEVSLQAGDKVGVLNHEVIHALKDLGLFTGQEWSALTKAVLKNQALMDNVRSRYEGVKGMNEEKLIEEAIADLHAQWQEGRYKIGGIIRSALERISSFIKSFGNALRGAGFNSDPTVGSVFRDVSKGTIGMRDVRPEVDPFGMYSVRRTPTSPAFADFSEEKIRRFAGQERWGAVFTRIDAQDFINLTTTPGRSRSEIMAEPFRTSNIKPYDNVDPEFDPADFDLTGGYAVPYLQVDDNGNVTGHEGRHRAAALLRGGAKTIPIAISPAYDAKWKNTNSPPRAIYPQNLGSSGSGTGVALIGDYFAHVPRNPTQEQVDAAMRIVGPQSNPNLLSGTDQPMYSLRQPATPQQASATASKVLQATGGSPTLASKTISRPVLYFATMQGVARHFPVIARFQHWIQARSERETALINEGEKSIERMTQLDYKPRKQIEAVMEFARLTNTNVTPMNGRITVVLPQNYTGILGRPGEVFMLDKEQSKIFMDMKKYFKNRWNQYGQAVADRWNYDSKGTVVVRVKEKTPNELAVGNEPFVEKTVEKWSELGIRSAIADAQAQGNNQRAKNFEYVLSIYADAKARENYVPFSRTGDEGFTVRNVNTGQVEYFEMVDTKNVWGGLTGSNTKKNEIITKKFAELQKKFSELDAKGDPLYEVTNGPVSKSDIEKLDVSLIEKLLAVTNIADKKDRNSAMNNILDALKPVGIGKTEVKNAIREGLLDSVKKAQRAGFTKESRNTPGYSTNFLQSIIDYNRTTASVVSGIEYGQQTDEAYDATQSNKVPENIRKYAERINEYLDSDERLIGQIKQYGFWANLWGSVSSALVNLSQTPTITATQIAGWGGVPAAGRTMKLSVDMLRALSFNRRQGITLDPKKIKFNSPEEGLAFMDAYNRGRINPTITQDLQGTAPDNLHIMSSKIGSDQSAKIQKVIWNIADIGSSAFYGAEQVNRATAWLAAYREAQRPGAVDKFKKMYAGDARVGLIEKDFGLTPQTIADFFVNETQFIGGKIDRPELLRGAGGVVFQFKQYPMNYLRILKNNMTSAGPEGKIAGTMMLMALTAFGGLLGLPFADDLVDSYEFIMKISGQVDPMIEYEMREVLEGIGASSEWAEAATRGPARFLGVDVSKRIGQGEILPEANPLMNMPVFGATIGKIMESQKRFNSDQPFGGAVALASIAVPKGPSDALRGMLQLPNEGYQTQRGDVKVKEPHLGQFAAKTMGFQPSEFASIQERDYFGRRLKYRTREAENKLSTSLASKLKNSIIAREKGDSEKADKLMREFVDRYQRAAVNFGSPSVPMDEKVRPPSMSSVQRRAMMMMHPELVVRSARPLKRSVLADLYDEEED